MPIVLFRADEKTSNMDPEQLDFDPEEDDETMLRLKALETQVNCQTVNEWFWFLGQLCDCGCDELKKRQANCVHKFEQTFNTNKFQAKKLIPNYGSPPKLRSDSEDSNVPTTSRYLFKSLAKTQTSSCLLFCKKTRSNHKQVSFQEFETQTSKTLSNNMKLNYVFQERSGWRFIGQRWWWWWWQGREEEEEGEVQQQVGVVLSWNHQSLLFLWQANCKRPPNTLLTL